MEAHCQSFMSKGENFLVKCEKVVRNEEGCIQMLLNKEVGRIRQTMETERMLHVQQIAAMNQTYMEQLANMKEKDEQTTFQLEKEMLHIDKMKKNMYIMQTTYENEINQIKTEIINLKRIAAQKYNIIYIHIYIYISLGIRKLKKRK